MSLISIIKREHLQRELNQAEFDQNMQAIIQLQSLFWTDGVALDSIKLNGKLPDFYASKAELSTAIEELNSVFTETQEQRLKDLVYEEAIQSISVAPTFFEKGVATDLVFAWNVQIKDDTLTSATLDGIDVTADANGVSSNYNVNGVTVTKNVNLTTVLDRKGAVVNLSNNRTATAYIPQYIGKMTTDEPLNTYVGLSAHTKLVQSSTNLSANINLNNEHLFFICNSSTKTVRDNLTGFTLSLGDWNSTTAFMIKKSFDIILNNGTTETVTIYRTREKKTQTLNISLV